MLTEASLSEGDAVVGGGGGLGSLLLGWEMEDGGELGREGRLSRRFRGTWKY